MAGQDAGAMTLGEMIRFLESVENKRKIVRFDFCDFVPTYFSSYRGFYGDLALGYVPRVDYTLPGAMNNITVDELLRRCKQANGSEFFGWKGGTYTMSLDTSVWVALEGEAPGTMISGIRDYPCTVILETRYIQ